MWMTDALRKRMAKGRPPVRTEEQEPAPVQERVEPVPAREPEPPQKHWQGDMVPRETGPGERIERSSRGGYWSGGSVRLEWVSRETDGEGRPLRVRTPDSHTVTVPKVGFMAAGKRYRGMGSLVYRQEKDGFWGSDIYGRDVLMVKERFPCFDSSDYLYENRCFCWYFLCEDGKLTCVYHTDQTDTVTVTEDVLDLEKNCWRDMKKLGCFE